MTRTAVALAALGVAVIGFGVGQHCAGPPPAELVGAGKEIERIYTPVYVKAAAEHTRDTIELTKWRTRYDTIRVLERITDTVWVKEYIRVSDSTIKACTDAVGSCGRTRAALEELNRGLRMELDGTRKQVRSAKRKGIVTTVAAFGAGWIGSEVVDLVRQPP